ncbi:N-6 DNA methylase [Acidimicrobiia bacterium]|nr:N-6 DNA methylase [Acidimicrobiia bacterium]
MKNLNYNERSWAIDLISEINLISSRKISDQFKATGEQTLTTKVGKLFPDLILQDFNLNVLQGWELKFPNTSILNEELLDNAKIKAESLNLESFLVWNVKEACLYLKNQATGAFEAMKTWESSIIQAREDVFLNSEEWKRMLVEILDDLNSFFSQGKIKTSYLTEVIDASFLSEIVENSYKFDIEIIKEKERGSSLFRSQMDNWWEFNKNSFGDNKYEAMSKINFVKWINKIIFVNTLNSYIDLNDEILKINRTNNVNDLLEIFSKVTNDHNFINIFGSAFTDEMLSSESMVNLQILNQLLYTTKLSEDIKKLYAHLIENNISKTNKKFQGFYTTPENLSHLLVELVIDDINGSVIDPCCGSGTILNSIRNYYSNFQDPLSVNSNIWGADKFDFPVQVSTISNVRPELIGSVINIFTEDVFNLSIEKEIKFINPKKPSETVSKRLPEFDYIISNLPFVSFNKINEYSRNEGIEHYQFEEISNEYSLGARSDLYYYIINHLNKILNENGKAGFITSNSWLGTTEGVSFKNLLLENFNIDVIVISGTGKWFENADVKTLLLILSKKLDKNNTKFVTLKKDVNQLTSDEIKRIKDSIVLESENEYLSIHTYSKDRFINLVESIGSSWMPLFVDNKWIDDDLLEKLIPLDSIFDISRGIRKGWNEMFYVKSDIDIEKEYLSPLYKSSSDYKALEIDPSTKEVAFDCNEDIEYLKINKPKAYSWIKRFETKKNKAGKLLPEALGKPDNWYKLTKAPFSDFMISQNPYKKLMVFKPSKKGVIDQRFICLTILDPNSYNSEVLHLLLNSIIFQFFIESAGFPRGLGALDINSTNFPKLKLLNPGLLNEKQNKHLINLFEPIKNRSQENLEIEFTLPDRIRFEETLLSYFGLDSKFLQIKNALIDLYKIRTIE